MHHTKLLWIAALAACASDATTDTAEQRATGRPVDDHTVTLITGDRVTLRGGAPIVTPGPGRTGIRFSVLRGGDQVRVIPRDVEPLLSAGRLDPALFDVTGLLAAGYGDRQRADLPLIVTGAPPAAFAPMLAAGEARALPALHMLALRQPKGGAAALASLQGFAAGDTKLWLDRIRKPSLDRSVPQIGGDVAHARGLTGTGVTVAVLDTGVDTSHPDLADRVALSADFTDDGQGTGDVLGHGTHVASIIAGTGAASGGQFAGVAPGARLISGRVCSGFGCSDSAILAGMAWAAVDQHARIINLSLGGPDTPELDPLEQAVNTLSAETGALFVIAAGNAGQPRTIESPGSADAALSVGAVDRDESLAFFSSEGPRVGDSAVKPEVTAPGDEIVAAMASGVEPIGTPVGTRYQALSGTSMATPHVAGAAALLVQQHPDWTGAQLKAQLIATANPNPTLDVFAEGAGRIDLDRATRQDVAAEPAVLSLGLAAFPHDDDPAIVRTLRYHNGGAAPITLALTASLDGPAGPAPIALSTTTVSVPAGGTSAPVTVTVHTDGPLADGLYSGAVVARAGDIRIETPVGVEREAEQFDLTLDVIADGAPGPAFVILFSASDQRTRVGSVEGRTTLRLPRGLYAVVADLRDQASSTIVLPRLALDHSQTVTFDGAIARPTHVDVGDPRVALATSSYGFVDHVTGFADFSIGIGAPVAFGQLGGDLPPDGFVGWMFDSQADGGIFEPARTIYNLAHQERGRIPIGFTARVTPDQLATVEAHHVGRPDALYSKGALPFVDDPVRGLIGGGFFASSNYGGGSFDRTEHFFGDGVVWMQVFSDQRILPDFPFPLGVAELTSHARYRAGQRLRETWNAPPSGPAFAKSGVVVAEGLRLASTATRTGDDLVLTPTMAGDASVPAHGPSDHFDHQRIALYRDGALVEERRDAPSGDPFTVPAGAATYRYEEDTVRSPDVFPLASHVSAAWTFRSAHTATTRPLPLLAMRFFPALDEAGATSARLMVLPIRFERAPDAGTALVLQAELEVSFDGGARFTRVPVAALGDRGLAVFVHPRGAKTVTLRGEATDLSGNRTEVTIRDAYSVK